jgi:hypothetical protein
VDAALLRAVEELFRLLEVTLMVMPDLSDDVAVRVVSDATSVDRQFSCHHQFIDAGWGRE